MRYGYHLVTDCRKANQGKKSHKDVEATITHHLNTYTSITATKAKPFSNGTQADILLSGIATIDNPAARNYTSPSRLTNPHWGRSANPKGVTNQEFINRAALNHQPGRANTIPALTSSPAQRVRRTSNTASTTPSPRPRGLTSLLSQALCPPVVSSGKGEN